MNNSGFLFKAAQDFHTLVIFAEHQYYGNSKPFSNKQALDDPYHISFLTVKQAMKDFNTLTPYICDKWAKTLETPFVAFGGSYGANMAMWLQLKKSKYNDWGHCLICTTAQTFPSRDQQVCQD